MRGFEPPTFGSTVRCSNQVELHSPPFGALNCPILGDGCQYWEAPLGNLGTHTNSRELNQEFAGHVPDQEIRDMSPFLLALLALDEVEDVLGVPPALADLDVEVEVDLGLEDALDLLAGLDADLLDELALAAE